MARVMAAARNAKQTEQVFRAGDFRLSAGEINEIESFAGKIARVKAAS